MAKKSKRAPRPKMNHLKCPQGLSVEEWQIALRVRAAEREKLMVRPVDKAKEGYFTVVNPNSGNSYSVVYRGPHSAWNYCSCPDFRTNRLRTCKHIEAVGLADDGKYVGKHYRLPQRTTIYLDYKGERRVRIRPSDEHRMDLQQALTPYVDREWVIPESSFGDFADILGIIRKIDCNVKCFDDAFDYIIDNRESQRRKNILATHPNMAEGVLKATLYPYQVEGAEFAFLHGRVIIADEMGLGKTIQAIASAMLLRRYGFVHSVWIVCPTSLKYQWKSEIEKFTDASVEVVEGNLMRRCEVLESEGAFFKIISYHSLVNVIRKGISRMPDMVIYDEVQRLKNWDTKMAKAMRGLKSEYVVALSGTPLENRLSELYSVMQLVDQYALGPYWQFTAETTNLDDTGRLIGYKNLNAIGERMSQTLLRRRKVDVRLQMPERTDKNLFVPVTAEQMAIHDDCKMGVSQLVARWRATGFLSEKDRRRLLQLLSVMRMSADSTYIVDQKTRYDTKIDEAISIIEDVIESGDEKIVVFSQWERMQRILAAELEALGIGFRFLHGSVPSHKRGELISGFTEDSGCRVFLSTDAGSTGLNLQVASIVINLDLPWNPAVLEQRIARVFRLGQQRQVQVINMVSVGTIEERMLSTLAFKAGLFEGVLDGGEDEIVLNDKKFDRIADLIEEEVPSISSEYEVVEIAGEEKEPEMEYAGESEDDFDNQIEPEEEYGGGESSWDAPAEEDDTESSCNHAPRDGDSPDGGGKPKRYNSTESSGNTIESKELIAKGMEFLGGLAKALSSEESRRSLLDSIVEEDPATGQTRIAIPVADKATVGNVLNMLAGLFG